ncbi:hypothetical protein RU639_011101 [Aspergillus parasiticus]
MGDSNSLSLDMALRTTMGAWVDLFTSYMAWGKALRDIVAQWVQQTPFSLVVKECDIPSRNEAIALRLVEQYTSIPAPRLVDLVEHQELGAHESDYEDEPEVERKLWTLTPFDV